MNRRAQGLSVNMIILIVLGLIVLVIAVLMFSNTSKKGQQQTDGFLDNNCKLVSGGECKTSCQETGWKDSTLGSCPTKGTTKEVCCVKDDTTTPTG